MATIEDALIFGANLLWRGKMILLVLINFVLIASGIAGFILLCLVLLKLNKALNIWLKQNTNE